MKQLSLSETKEISLSILKYVSDYCNEKGIRYFVAYGTLLGAVRHGGFIPWDDDVDLVMLRQDYEKFVESARVDFTGRYKCISFTQSTFVFPYAKIIDTETTVISDNVVEIENHGMGIDIFPYDYISDSAEQVDDIAKKLILPKKMLRYSLYPNSSELRNSNISIIKTGLFYFAKAVGWNKWRSICKKRIQDAASSDKKKYCGYLGCFEETSLAKIESTIFDDTVDLKFEDIMVRAPKRYDEYLRLLYGDYMQLPPEEKRIPHAQKVYWNE